MYFRKIICLILSICFVIPFNNKDYINEEIKRKINLEHDIIYVENEIKIKQGDNPEEDVYRYVVPKNNTESLLRIICKTNEGKDVPMKKISHDKDFDYYEIELKYLSTNKFIVYEDYFEKLKFKPEKITIKEEQLELFLDTVNLISAYLTKSQITTVILPNNPSGNLRLIKYTMKNSNKSGNKLIYSLSKEVSPFTSIPLYIHYENNKPLKLMRYGYKSYYVSHWGNIAVQEDYSLENVGATLVGEFGRVDYDDSGRRGGKNALKELTAILPLRSWGLWYRDEIGNVSTSFASRQWDNVKLELNPRFPILGGWKSNFGIGYNLPSKFHISTNNQGKYLLNLTFGMPFEDILAKNYTVKVVLPEGADNIKVNLPIKAEYTVKYDKEYGCLDLFGRKSIIINLFNMYDVYNTNFYITYDYQWAMLFVKPVIVVSYFLAIFLIVIIYSRADISLKRMKKPLLKDKEKNE